MIATKTKPQGKVYSYDRWSKPSQDDGDSERRQSEIARAFAKREGLKFDETLQDKGLSGFHGTHRKRGALGRFLEAVEAGDVPRDSILVVENIDRLSREGIAKSLRKIIFKLWDYGISIQTLIPEERYEPGCESEPKFIALLLYLKTAHDESKRKSNLMKATRAESRKQALQNGKKMNGQYPDWLEPIKDGNGNTVDYKFRPKAKETIQSIFDMRLDGMGKLATTQRLNETAEWTPPPRRDRKTGKLKEAKWGQSYVYSILRDRAVIGEHQLYKFDENGDREKDGEPLRGYFPAVLDDDKIFYSVQKLLEQNKGKNKGGRRGKVKNLFSGITHCGYCGDSMVMVNGGSKKNNPDYLVCSRHRLHKGCVRNSINYNKVQDPMLIFCSINIKPSDILPNQDKQKTLRLSLSKQLQALEVKQKDTERMKQNQIINCRGTTDPEMVKVYEKDIAELRELLEQITKQKGEVERQYHKAQNSIASITKQLKDIADLREVIKKKDSIELRLKLKMKLAELIERIEVYGNGDKAKPTQVKFIRQKTLFESGSSYVLKKSLKKELANFAKYVVKCTRGSKKSCFIKITFKTGNVIVFWPRGSVTYDLEFRVNKSHDIDWNYITANHV
ncbi:MAG: recombinase family protein [Planctomycetota bacterium]|jgi:hypothetical protein